MDITYNIKDEKEVIFVISRFNKALKKGDFEQALSIQKYIMNKIAEGKAKAILATLKNSKIDDIKKLL